MADHPDIWPADAGYVTFTFPPAFPTTVGVGDAKITLHANGDWTGDGPAFLAALKEMRSDGIHGAFLPMFWMVARAIRETLNLR